MYWYTQRTSVMISKEAWYCVNVIFSMKPHCSYKIDDKSMKAYTNNGKGRAICTVFHLYNSTYSSNTLYKYLLLLI